MYARGVTVEVDFSSQLCIDQYGGGFCWSPFSQSEDFSALLYLPVLRLREGKFIDGM